MRKHGWQLPYHPLQVSVNFSVFFFFCRNSFWGLLILKFLCEGGGYFCVFSVGVCFLRVLRSFCWKQDVSVYCHCPLHTAGMRSVVPFLCFLLMLHVFDFLFFWSVIYLQSSIYNNNYMGTTFC